MKLPSQVTSEIILILMCILVIFVFCQRSGYSIDFNGPIIDVKLKVMTQAYSMVSLSHDQSKTTTLMSFIILTAYDNWIYAMHCAE